MVTSEEIKELNINCRNLLRAENAMGALSRIDLKRPLSKDHKDFIKLTKALKAGKKIQKAFLLISSETCYFSCESGCRYKSGNNCLVRNKKPDHIFCSDYRPGWTDCKKDELLDFSNYVYRLVK